MRGLVRVSNTDRINNKRLRRGVTTAALLTACALPVASATAGGTIAFGDGESVSLGLGLRSSFTSTEHGAPDGSRSSDFSLDSVRLYIGASLNDHIKATFNTERNGNGDVEVLDGYAQFEFADEFNVWVGRMLPPSDRANLDGPYYLNTWLYPGVVSQYPAKFAGRDDGATLWGKLLDKKLVYSAGAFEGHNRIGGASNTGDNLLYAGRIAYNFLDAEPDPAYYESSTYYGSVDILTLAFAAQYEADGVGTAARRGDYTGWNMDLLFEKKLSFGVVTLEGAYYNYDTDGVKDVAPNFNGAGPTANVGGITQGDGYLIGAAYLFPQKVGWGQFQPFFRYQSFDADLNRTTSNEYDLGVNYVIDAHNARISLDYSKNDGTGTQGFDRFIAGIQLQF
ncbi:MAG: hypothetical protein JWM91_659 [Rhodospirillales bacterium]|nr:hypothetical protein [Rhodospirillales bacterium]